MRLPILLLLASCQSIDCATQDPDASGVFHVRDYEGIRYTFTPEYLDSRGWGPTTVVSSRAALDLDDQGRPLWACPTVDGVQVYATIEVVR